MKEPRIKFSEDRLQFNFDVTHNGRVIKKNMITFYKDIESITIEYCQERVGFKDYESERIVIRTKKMKTPVIYYGIKEFSWYEDYKNGLRKFAADNGIKLVDDVLT